MASSDTRPSRETASAARRWCGATFVGRRGSAAKALFFDGSGRCIDLERLDRGVFRVPASTAEGATHLEIGSDLPIDRIEILDPELVGVAGSVTSEESSHLASRRGVSSAS